MKQLLVFLFSLSILAIHAQIKPDIFPEDIEIEEDQGRCYCSPGVVNQSRSRGLDITYERMGSARYEEEDVAFQLPLSSFKAVNRLKLNLKAPVYLKENLKILLGYKYFSESFNFDRIGTDFSSVFQKLNAETLKSSSLSLIVSKPLNETKYLAFRLRYSANGDYDGILSFDKNYGIYKFLGMYGIKKHDFFEWGIGLNISSSFRRTNVLPFVMLKKTFNDQWGIEAVLPAYIYGRYNIRPGDILLFGFKYGSKSYRLDIQNTNLTDNMSYEYNHSEFMYSVKLEHRFAPWVWANVELGFQDNFSSDFEGINDFSTNFKAEPNGHPFFNIGIFISPPQLN